MDLKRGVDRGARGGSESPPSPPSPPAYNSTLSSNEAIAALKYSKGVSRRSPPPPQHDSQASPGQDKRRKRRSGSRSSSTRSHKRSRSRDREKDRERDKERSRKHSRRDRSRSRSKERRRSRSRNKSRDRHRHREGRRHHRQASYEADGARDDFNEMASASQSLISAQSNAFKNDGSFMEMFKKMQEQMPGAQLQPAMSSTANAAASSSVSVLQEKTTPPPPLMVGKRRGGRILKTGMVAKPKTEPTAEQPKDAWSLYMAEVKKYREVCCQEEDNTRPLVK